MMMPALTRRVAALLLALGLLAQALPANAASSARGRDEVIARLGPDVDPQMVAARAGLVPLDRLGALPVYRFAITDGSTAREKAAALAAVPGVTTAEPNLRVVSPWAQRRSSWVVGSDAEGYAAQWAPARLGLPAAHAVTRGRGVTVAILDTGVDVDHPALVEHLDAGYDFVDDDADPREVGSPADAAFGHGTHVAGLVALVAPEARILPLRTLRPDGSGDLWTQLAALRFAAAQGAQVINMSFSFGERSRIFDDAVALLTCNGASVDPCRGGRPKGAVAVAAAGNSGAPVREFPGASTQPGLLGVAASNEADTLASFSTYGSWLPLAAPGELIVSTVPGGGYAAWSGTSMAAPLVAGTVALVRSAAPQLSPSEAARRVVETADPIDGRVRRRLDTAGAVGASASARTDAATP
jgi:subtilisin family serine protease